MTFTRHPVDIPIISQPWGANRTGGVTPDPNGTAIQQLVYNYGNYQAMGHDGIDYACPIGTPVYAPGPGVIEWSGWGQDMPQHIAVKYGFVYGPGGWPSGILVCMDHGGIGSYVAHLSESYYEAGKRVDGSVIVGLSGNTGRSGGPHVHFSAIRFPVNYADPLYSRVNPLPLFTAVTHVPIRPGATGDPATVQEDTLSAAEVKQIKDHINAVLLGGYTWEGKKHPGIGMVVEENQRRIDRIPDRVWRETTVRRGGKDVPVLQDLADGTTYALASLDGDGLSPEDLTAIRAEMDEAVEAVKGTVNVVVSTATTEPKDQP